MIIGAILLCFLVSFLFTKETPIMFSDRFLLKHKHIMASNDMDRKHYVLVHGACHGAWCWYKLKPRLESAGHRVTVLDLAASGINSKKIEDVGTFSEYSEPLLHLLASFPTNEKVILVGHSFGGLSIALAMEIFPGKVAVGIFLTAFMPDTQHRPSYVLEEEYGTEEGIFTFSPEALANKLYQLSPTEDLELAKTLVRLWSVPRAFIICNKDLAIPLELQRWMIQNAGVNLVDVEEIEGADHMAMFSKTREVSDALLKIAANYA